jgi:Amt family ammonium transporter
VLAVSAALAGLVVPLLGFWAHLGWLARLDLIDAAGGCWVHVAGGAAAAAAAWAVGPRANKYHRDGSASVIPGHSVPLRRPRAMLLFAGWRDGGGRPAAAAGRRSWPACSSAGSG